jgi:hypothetical protein
MEIGSKRNELVYLLNELNSRKDFYYICARRDESKHEERQRMYNTLLDLQWLIIEIIRMIARNPDLLGIKFDDNRVDSYIGHNIDNPRSLITDGGNTIMGEFLFQSIPNNVIDYFINMLNIACIGEGDCKNCFNESSALVLRCIRTIKYLQEWVFISFDKPEEFNKSKDKIASIFNIQGDIYRGISNLARREFNNEEFLLGGFIQFEEAVSLAFQRIDVMFLYSWQKPVEIEKTEHYNNYYKITYREKITPFTRDDFKQIRPSVLAKYKKVNDGTNILKIEHSPIS